MNRHGEIIFSDWFQSISTFNNEFVSAKVNDTQRLILNKELKVVKTINNKITSFFMFDSERYIYCIDGKTAVYDKDGNRLSDYFKYGYGVFDGFSRVFDTVKGWNFVDRDGKLLSEDWFTDAKDFCKERAHVLIGKKGYNFIDTTGKTILPVWCEYISLSFYDNCSEVKLENKWNLIDRDGQYIYENFVPYEERNKILENFVSGARYVKFINNKWTQVYPFKKKQ